MQLPLAALVVGVVAVSGFGSSDDRFLKKYAMMKIYESCFGAEVVKEIRQEMRAACARCAASADPPRANPMLVGRLPPSILQAANSGPYEIGQDANSNGDNLIGPQMSGAPPGPDQASSLDTDKLQQAIYSLRIPQPIQSYQVPNFGYRSPFGGAPFQQSPFQQGAFPPASPFQPQLYQQPQPYMPWGQAYPGGFQAGYVQPYSYFGNRASREMDFRTRLEILTSRTSGQVRNVTCVMQELGYLDQNLEPNFEKISERIANLPVSNELKSDIQDGLQFCQEFSQCVPESKKNSSPLSRELLKPMFFFRCYKHKKLEACIMKDVREKFGGEEEIETETDFRNLARSGRAMKNDGSGTSEQNSEELEAAMFDFLYGNQNSDSDSFF